MAPDTWARHHIVSGLVGTPATVLDVGGLAGELAAFLPGVRVVSANLGPEADVVFDGHTLPFAEDSFDAAVSIDVLEHLPPDERAAHIAELARVTRRTVVICCPLGSEGHESAERELAVWHRQAAGKGHPFLEEHLEYGLPREEDLRRLANEAPLPLEVRFHGDFRETSDLFRRAVTVRHRPRPAAAVAYLRSRLRRPDTALDERATPTTNRAFLFGSWG